VVVVVVVATTAVAVVVVVLVLVVLTLLVLVARLIQVLVEEADGMYRQPVVLGALFSVMSIHFLLQQQQPEAQQLRFQVDTGTTILLALGVLFSNGTFCIN
jgi:hypothetical protein